MDGEWWVTAAALVAISLASISVQGWASRAGEERTAYVVALGVCLALGVGVAGLVGTGAEWMFLGGACGLAAVAVGPVVKRVVEARLRSRAKE